jgi:hypothetical protein
MARTTRQMLQAKCRLLVFFLDRTRQGLVEERTATLISGAGGGAAERAA